MHPKYNALRVLIDTGALNLFEEILDHIPAEELAEDLDWELSYLMYIINNPKVVTLDILSPIADLINCEIDCLFWMVMRQFIEDKKNPGTEAPG